MKANQWIKEFSAAVTVCDVKGVIVEMNEKSVEVFAKDGGAKLIGTDVLSCHPEPALSKLKAMFEGRRTNVYTIEKNGKKKLIYQAPWHDQGRYAGFVELSIEIPWEVPHFKRD